MNKLHHLIRYALEQGVLCAVSSGEDGAIYSLGDRRYRLLQNGASYIDEDGLRVALRRELPIIEVIDLICAAAECGVISDGTPGRKLLEYGGDYTEICGSRAVFIFCIVSQIGEGKTFKTVFSPDAQDVENGIEYAHRSSAFVDMLIKRVMNKYGVLYSDGICGGAETLVLSAPPLHSDVVFVGRETLKIEKRSSEPIALIKMLIRYRDTSGGGSFVRNIIDDIYLHISPNGGVEWSFPKIFTDNDNGDISDLEKNCRVVSVEERKKAEALMRVIESPAGKRAMFTALKENEASMLYGVIQSRKKEYAASPELPKVEFSITPLAMYCSYPIIKTLTYTLAPAPEMISGNRYLSGFEVEYSVSFPDSEIGEYRVEHCGKRVKLTEENPLTIAFTNDFTREKYPKAVPAPLDRVTALGKLNPEYYGSAELENVHFLSSEIITGETLEGLAYDKDLPFLRSDVKRCLVEGKYYHVRDLIKVDAAVKDGMILAEEDGGYVRKCEENTYVPCSHCGSIYGGRSADVEKYIREHRVCNKQSEKGEPYYCCDRCVGEIGEGEKAVLRVRVPGEDRIRFAYVLEDLKGKSELCVCSWLNELIYAKEAGVCDCCGERLSKIKIDEISGRHLCHFCVGKLNGIASAVKASDLSNGLWRELKRSLRFGDAKRKQCEILERGDLLWVYRRYSDADGLERMNSYCFIKMSLGKRSLYLLKGISTLKMINGVWQIDKK